MPIQRFRTFEEAERALWTDSKDPALPRRLRMLWAFTARLARRRYAPGLYRFRSIEDANHHRELSERNWVEP